MTGIIGHRGLLLGGGGGQSLYELIMADLATAGSGYYFRHAESSGSVMVNEVGDDGAYLGSPTFGMPPLYAGGLNCVSTGPSGTFRKSGGALPAMTELSIVTICNLASLSSFLGLITSDSGVSGGRSFQFRTNGSSLEWVKIAGGVVTKSFAAGLSVDTTYMLGVEIANSGTPGTSNISFYQDGSAIYTSTIATADYGTGFSEFIEIGSITGSANNFGSEFSETAIITDAIGSARWLEYADAAGLA